ncbi:MAG: hypothetical protein IKB38_00380 [Clostridia bacterium]|nr:hypothetical protein [Clostridia bacterium]
MKYENLKLEILTLDSSDVIATSADVTTGGITMPWQTAPTDPQTFNLMSLPQGSGYDT